MPIGDTSRRKVLRYQQAARYVLNRAASRRPAASVCRASQADRAVLERAGSREPANRGLAHTVGARQIGLHSAVSEPLLADEPRSSDRLSLPDELASLYGGVQRDDRCCR